MLYSGRESGAKPKCEKGAGYLEIPINRGDFLAPTRLSEVKRSPLKNRASSATLDAQSTATELCRGPNMRRNVPMGALLAPHPKARERNLGRRRKASLEKQMRIFYI